MTILTGCPGTGKSTIAKGLSQLWSDRDVRVACVEADAFYPFLTPLITPDRPEANEQNKVVAAAIASSAIAFAEGGYKVIIEGVVGPWMLPEFLKVFRERLLGLSYVVLRAPLEETLHRALSRPDGDKYAAEGVAHMHRQFADLKMFEAHAVDVSGQSPEETLQTLDLAICNRDYQFEIG